VVFSNIAQSSTEVMDVVKDCHQTSPKVLPKWLICLGSLVAQRAKTLHILQSCCVAGKHLQACNSAVVHFVVPHHFTSRHIVSSHVVLQRVYRKWRSNMSGGARGLPLFHCCHSTKTCRRELARTHNRDSIFS